MTTNTMPKVGDKVRATFIPHVTHDGSSITDTKRDNWEIQSLETTVTIVQAERTPPRLYGDFTARRRGSDTWGSERWFFTAWEPVTAMPSVGQRVIARNIPGYSHHEGTAVTITSVDGNVMTAEFPSTQKPDDTLCLAFTGWEPIISDEPITFDTRDRLIGRTIRVCYSGSSAVHNGELHKVTSTFQRPERNNEPKIDGITVGVTVEDYGTAWVQAYELVEDGETLTVSYTPAVGDYVKVTGRLEPSGIVDGMERYGIVTSVDNGVYIVAPHSGGDNIITGPGYVFAAEKPVEEFVVEQTAEQKRIAFLEDQNKILMKSVDDWQHDFDHLANEVKEEAINRDWCDEYERVMSRVEAGLKIGTLPEREQEYEVEVRVTGNVSVSTTVTVTARSQDEADSKVGDDISEYVDVDEVLLNEVRYNGWDDTDTEVE